VIYRSVGPRRIIEKVPPLSPGVRITSLSDWLNWAHRTRQQPDAEGLVIATFVIDLEGFLRIGDRRSEHVACADGRPVLAAGEIGAEIDRDILEVVVVTNQSTGYCPSRSAGRTSLRHWTVLASATQTGSPGSSRFGAARLAARSTSSRTIGSSARSAALICPFRGTWAENT
jgi:hypothetical protein